MASAVIQNDVIGSAGPKAGARVIGDYAAENAGWWENDSLTHGYGVADAEALNPEGLLRRKEIRYPAAETHVGRRGEPPPAAAQRVGATAFGGCLRGRYAGVDLLDQPLRRRTDHERREKRAAGVAGEGTGE